MEILDDKVTWVELMKQVNDDFDPGTLDLLDRILLYDYAMMCEVVPGQKPEDTKWKHVSVAMSGSCKTPLPEPRPEECTTDNKSKIELKNMYVFHEELKYWLEPDEGRKMYRKLLEFTVTSDNKLDFIEHEMPILKMTIGKAQYLVKFGSTVNREKYRRALNWFFEGGADAFMSPDDGGGGDDEGGKKKKKKK